MITVFLTKYLSTSPILYWRENPLPKRRIQPFFLGRLRLNQRMARPPHTRNEIRKLSRFGFLDFFRKNDGKAACSDDFHFL